MDFSQISTVLEKPESFIGFIVLVLPGFVTLRVYESFVPSERRKAAEALIDIVAYSISNDVLWYAALRLSGVEVGRLDDAWLASLALASILVTPSFLAFGWFRLQVFAAEMGWMNSPIRKPWDYIFTRIRTDVNEPEFIVIVLTMQDGRKIGGAYVAAGFASSYPADEQLLIGQIWQIEPNTGEPIGVVPGSYGLLVDKRDVQFVEFYKRSTATEDGDGAKRQAEQIGPAAQSAGL